MSPETCKMQFYFVVFGVSLIVIYPFLVDHTKNKLKQKGSPLFCEGNLLYVCVKFEH